MITQKRLMERIDSWDKHARKCFEDFQATGSGVYQSRARKYEEYTEIAQMALDAFDSLQEVQRLQFWLRHYKSLAGRLAGRIQNDVIPEDPDFQEDLRLMLESLSEVTV